MVLLHPPQRSRHEEAMALQHPIPPPRRRRRRNARQTSVLVFACTIPFATLILLWQHTRLMDHLEGGGEYAAELFDREDGNTDDNFGEYGINWGESVRQAVDVVKFVGLWPGLMSENDDELIMDDDDDDDDDAMTDNEVDDQEIIDEDEGTQDKVVQNSNANSNVNLDQHETAEKAYTNDMATSGSIIPTHLSVNHLQLINDAPGKPSMPPLPPNASAARTSEDFLPVAESTDKINFRWRHEPKVGSLTEHSAKVTAYRIEAQRSGISGTNLLWDSNKVHVDDDEALPLSVSWPKETTTSAIHRPKAGDIIQWRVTLWDVADNAHTSKWSKFAVGPSTENDWKGQWIVHPSDMKTFKKEEEKDTPEACDLWKKRHPLPLFRGEILHEEIHPIVTNDEDSLSSALLVVSGLGSFRASFDGVPLTTSGPIDPPFTDYTQRVMYRGFDVTSFLSGGNDNNHVIGITMGSGWWDHRPLQSSIVKLELLPRGPATVIAQLYLTTSKGKIHIVSPTQGGDNGKWTVSRGHIRESDLFTGEIVDVDAMAKLEGWNTINSKDKWSTHPVTYHTDVTLQNWREEISIRAKAKDRSSKQKAFVNFAAPIGKLVPSEIPPVMAMERIPAEEIQNLGNGRWLYDFGKAFSGMLHFEQGLPTPIIPDSYPRGHGFKAATDKGDSFITVIYGESLEMTTGDINRVLTAGMGLHDGGPRHVSNDKGSQDNAYCFPDDHDAILSQRDVFVFTKQSLRGTSTTDKSISRVRQSHFTTHAFRFAEVCCSATPPDVYALLYRTAFTEWGTFDSSNILLNSGYELVKNAMASNMLSVQSDCPHREKLPYGGDLIADSPAAMHMYDMSSFYKKTVNDWLEAQWDNGAYTETSVWQDLNDYAGIGHGAGETVWATAPPVLTVRHMQHYGDVDFLTKSLPYHIRWLEFLNKNFDIGMREKGYNEEFLHKEYDGDGSGLGDWLALRSRDTYLTHTAFYMAAARCVAYISNKLGKDDMKQKSLQQAELIRKRIVKLYLKNGKDDFDPPMGHASNTPGPEMSLFSKIVPGEKRCAVLKNWFRRSGSLWPGDEEKLFLSELDNSHAKAMVKTGELVKESDGYYMIWSQWQGFNEGIFAIRYSLKTLSDLGFHHIALRKAAGFGFGTPEYMMRHNATTMWETWWRSEDVYSRNHPMLGAIAEWMVTAAAGVGHYPTTTGSKKMLFWPRFPKSATMLEYASAIQGSPLGDYAIAWRFEDLPEDKKQYNSAVVKVRIRLLVPPGGKGSLRLPLPVSKATKYSISESTLFPDLQSARKEASIKCNKRRQKRLGFPYSWEYIRDRKKWQKFFSGKSIGTPCESFLFSVLPLKDQWGKYTDITKDAHDRKDKILSTGLHEIIITSWKLEDEVEGNGRIGNIPEYYKSDNQGPYCKDSKEFEWNIDDATHII